jgi:hypothetical protein
MNVNVLRSGWTCVHPPQGGSKTLGGLKKTCGMNKVVSQPFRRGQRARRTTAAQATTRAGRRTAHPREHRMIRRQSASGLVSRAGLPRGKRRRRAPDKDSDQRSFFMSGGLMSPFGGQYRTVIGAIAAARSGMVWRRYWRPSGSECHHFKAGCRSPAARGPGLMFGVGLTRNTS